MPSLRQRVTTYFRQLSFIAEPRNSASLSPRNHEDGCFITKYLQGRLDSSFVPGPEILHGKEPIDLPDFPLAQYEIGVERITASYTGPDEGLTGVKRSRLHLSAGPDIDFIDTNQEQDAEIRHSISISSLKNKSKFGAINKSDQNANKSCNTKRTYSRKNSIVQEQHPNTINVIVSMVSTKPINEKDINSATINLRHSDNLNKNNTPTIDLVQVENIKINLVNNTENNIKSPDDFQKEELEPIAGVTNWKQENDHAYGLAVSLYEKNPITNEQVGNPVADCFGLVSRGNTAALAIADGVNWGEGARLAARSAVQGSLEYLNTAVFGLGPGGMATSTREVFISLLRSFWEAHACILEVGGALTTLTVAVVLPLAGQNKGKYVVCACNVGDSLGYIYSKTHGVREITQGSHDITSMRDMRDALGALGPVDGKDPELSNLTLSLTLIDEGDIIFLTSDGICDNFDPVVGKFAEALTAESQIVNQPKNIEPQLAPKRQNKSTSAIYSTKKPNNELMKSGSSSKIGQTSKSNPSTSSVPSRPVRTKKPLTATLSIPNQAQPAPSRPKYMRSHTLIEPRVTRSPIIKFPKSATGLPLVTGMQRHALTLLRLEDLLCYGINGTLRPCSNAKKLCHLLVDFAKMITSAKRKILEQRELYYKISIRPDGTKREIELNRIQQRATRKKVVEGSMFSHLPGKLDHASVVAYVCGAGKFSESSRHIRFDETNF